MREIKRILCPVDLSDISGHALQHAMLLGKWYDAPVTTLHVTGPVVLPAADFAVVRLPPSAADIAETRARVTACLESAGVPDSNVIVETGEPVDQILEHAKTLPADLVVIGTHGVGGFQHLVLGSTTEKVLRKATCPVLTVPPHVRTTSKLPFKRILCPVDFSDSSQAALNFAFSLAQEGDAELTVLHVFEWSADGEPLTNRPINVPEFRRELETDLTTKLEALVPDSVRSWCRPITRVAHGKAYREILGIATEGASDLIVIGVHGRNALDLMLFGSTTNQVVRRATCPVLTLRS